MQFQLKNVLRMYNPKNKQYSSNQFQYGKGKRNSLLNPFLNNTLQRYLHQSIRNINSLEQNQQNNNNINNNTNNKKNQSDSYIQQKRLNKKLPKPNFLKCFQQQIIIQFSNAYLPLIQIQPYLLRIEKIYQFYHRLIYKQNRETILALKMPYKTQIQLDILIDSIRDILTISQHKYEKFLKFKLSYVLHDWKILIQVLLQMSLTAQDQIQIRTQEKCQRKHYIKQIIKVIFTNIKYMIDFIQLNEQTFYFLRKDITKFLMPRMKYIKKGQTWRDNWNGTIKEKDNSNSKQKKTKHNNKKKNNNNNIYNRNLKSSIILNIEPHDNQSLNNPHQHYYNYHNFQTSHKQILDESIEQHIDYEYEYNQYNANQLSTQKNLAKLFTLMNNETITKSSYKKIFYSLEISLKYLYTAMVYHNEQKANKLEAYSTINKLQSYSLINKKIQSHQNHFLMGFYMGVALFMIFTLMLLLVFGLIEFDENDTVDSMNYVFPMFRGIGLLILYLWGMAWNIYGFTKFRINHRLILEYGSHYSTHFQMMKRAGFFTLIFSMMLLTYCTIQSLTIKEYFHQSSNLVEYTPFVVYVIYFSYIFFPNRDVFNPKGRRYFYDLLTNIILSPVLKITFVITWASDQAVSFVIPFKDFAYTICVYTSVMDLQSSKDCLNPANKQGVLVTYVVAILPLILRMVQCYRQSMQSSGRFIGHIQMWNFLKYFSTVITATMSYISTLEQQFFLFFIISSIISTFYSYYWDLKNDWGLLQKNSKYKLLRNHLCYKNPNYYYLAITINLLLRCTWTLTISPSIVALLHKSTFLPFLTGSLEIFRRCMWNFIRIQKQHLVNCQDYIIMRPQVQKIAQKLKKKQNKNERYQINQEDQGAATINKIKKQFIDKIHNSLNLPDILGKYQYETQWKDLNKSKIAYKKKDFLEVRQKQKRIFNNTKHVLSQRQEQFQQSIY